jgi:ligand-binding sensor domain-containing protein/signal transduction histidine kinase
VLLLGMGAARTSIAAPPSTLRLSEYQKQDWQVEDGLPENNVRMIAQQPDGTLLLANSSGLSSFDGQRFQSLPIEVAGLVDHEAVNAILYGRNGDLWIGTDGRGVLRRTSTGTVNVSEQAGRFNERIRTLHQDAAGAIWIATQNGIERFAEGHLEVITGAGMISGDIITGFAEDGAGGMFFVTSSGLFHWADGVAEPFALHTASSAQPVAVYRDPQQRLWVGTMNGLLELVPRKTAKADADPSLPVFDVVRRGTVPGAVSVLLGDGAGNLWIGTRRDGLWRLGGDGLTRWTSRDGMPDDAIRSLFLDDEQNLWIGMLTGGLSRWRKGALAPYGEPEGFHATFFANTFADSRGDLWLGTWGRGLFRRHNGQLLPTSPPGMPITTPIRALAEDRKGQIWVGTWFDGIYRWDGRMFRHYLLGVESPGNAVSSLLPDKVGGLWVGTYTGLFYFPSGEPNNQRRSLLLGSQLITCLLEDMDGSILVGTSTGLYRVREGRATPVTGLPHPYVLSLTLDSAGDLWAGTKAGGLAIVRGQQATPLPAATGLSPLPVNTAIEDGDGHLWLGTSRGIMRLSVQELHAAANGQPAQLSTMILGKGDGMRSSETGGASKPTSTRMPDGTLWFVTAKGFVHTTDVSEKLGTFHPVATIAGWALSSDASITDPVKGSRLDLEPGQPDILLFFNAKLLANPAHVEFRYRLKGYDADWTITRAHVARYRRLPAGKYAFEVQARSGGETWTSAIASLPIRQYPHLYETWYFYLVLAALVAALAVTLLRRRVERIRGHIGVVLEERNRIARECHDTLMAGFAAISWQLEATAKLFREGESGSVQAAKSFELARSMVSHCQAEARRIIWDLRDTDEVTNLLSQAIHRSLEANRHREAITATLDVEGDELPLAPGCVHHLVCIGQEAVANALRHAAPTTIVIHLRYESEALSLSIRDDGRGFLRADAAAARGGHFGIPVMEERARKIGGSLRLHSTLGVGTEVVVRVSFNAMQSSTNPDSGSDIIRWIGI